MNKLARHEAAQRASRTQWERLGYLTFSMATTEVFDFLVLSPGPHALEGKHMACVEIKTGTGRLSAKQAAELPVLARSVEVIVEHWSVVNNLPPQHVRSEAVKAAQ